MGKSITATLIGLLVKEGVYDLWTSRRRFREWQRARRSARARSASPICCACRAACASSRRRIRTTMPDKGYPDHLYVYTGAIDAFHCR